jgi:hypothetical protein
MKWGLLAVSRYLRRSVLLVALLVRQKPVFVPWRLVLVQELEALRGRRERVEQMERDRDALLDSHASMAPGVLEALTPEERHQFYKMGGLEVLADADGSIEVSGPLVMSPEVCTLGSTT